MLSFFFTVVLGLALLIGASVFFLYQTFSIVPKDVYTALMVYRRTWHL